MGRSISEEDKKVVDFLIKKCPASGFMTFTKIAGPAYAIAESLDKLKEEKVSKTIEVTCIIWFYITVYELILQIVHDRLIGAIDQIPSQYQQNFRDKIKDEEHVAAGFMNKTFAKILGYNEKNNKSIFAESDLRNKLSHAGLFYDSGRNRIITITGNEITFEEFNRKFEMAYTFLAYLLEESFKKEEITVDDFPRILSELLNKIGDKYVRFIRIPQDNEKFRAYCLELEIQSTNNLKSN